MKVLFLPVLAGAGVYFLSTPALGAGPVESTLWESEHLLIAPVFISFVPEATGEIVSTEFSLTLDTSSGDGVDASLLEVIVVGTFFDPASQELFGVSHVFTGADFGFSGLGTFSGSVETDALNGLLPDPSTLPPDTFFTWEVGFGNSAGGFVVFGEGSGSLVATIAVPAPGTAVLGLGFASVVRRRRR